MSMQQKYKTSFNLYLKQSPQCIARPENYAGLHTVNANVIARGFGGSYGDAALNKNGHIILTERLDRFLAFDKQQGLLCVEAGISLAKILEFIVPCGWYLPVTPGTTRVSIGGCVASDVHGKNHFQAGSISHYVTELEIIIASGETITCSPEMRAELFWATVGGMGLTGIIGAVTLKLKPIETAYLQVNYQTADNLAQTFDSLALEDTEDEYAVAWLDALNFPQMTAITIKARHTKLRSLSLRQQANPLAISPSKSYHLPCYLPRGLLNRRIIGIFNKYYYQRLSKRSTELVSFQNYFYPLDQIVNWPRLYGRQGFLQYQCAMPAETAYITVKKILEILNQQKYAIYLAVLKRLGPSNPAPLSFPLSGYTLAIDLPVSNQGLFVCLDQLDALVIGAGGRVYLAKDARLKPDVFQSMYPRLSEWLTTKRYWDPTNKFSSSLARRLALESY
jgi:decaprenylphospho-beta-D-ribofuranose 2-oxidase